MTNKKKTKELGCWEKELEKLSEQYDDYFTAVALDDVKKLISKLLTQQRTELLEEIKKLIDRKPIRRNELEYERFMNYGEKVINGYRRWLKLQIINLLNKKDE